ncbi:sensor histidine kinase [Sanguibacter suaedae]|uniref:histidine kinase n=1 Tax=Sanguibacter suaedae TaxID=2795737 RepID=A0A934M9Y9_9MICO|nr:DUF4118 domain-containing protein [Sanguibacter suaedae]MBI9113681.1 DUF4118 domain-containing protein [Sanguibacter suaedae]
MGVPDVWSLVRPPARLGALRATVGWTLAVAGPPLLTWVLLLERDVLGLASDLMFFFTLVVVAALVGGLVPSLVCALLASSLLNFYFTEPVRRLTVADPEDALALVVFVLVALAVASVVDLAERRSVQAREARDEATLLADLSRAVLTGKDSAQGVVDEIARRFSAPAAVLSERVPDAAAGDGWSVVAVHPAPDPVAPTSGTPGTAPDGSDPVVDTGRVRVALPGTRPSPGDVRVLEAFAAQVVLVLDRERLRERAGRARELEQGNAVRTAILTAASHDLRTPLAAIRAAVDGLAGPTPLDDADRAWLVETIESSTGRLERLVDNLLDLSRLQTGAVRPTLRAVSLDEILPVALDGLDVVLDLPESLPLARTDPGLLERVVENLATNAVRHAPSGRPAQVVARAVEDTLEVRVVDDGPGVDPRDHERMFRAFERLDAGGAGGYAGMGLGLAVVRGLTDAVDARVRVEQTPGGGLTMVVVVPRADTTGATPSHPTGGAS